MLKLIVFGVLCLWSGYCTSSESGSGKDWWQGTILYQIYPRSFKDSDGDGIGDLKGIISKLDYLKDTGIGATWLSPIFQSPMKDFGYDIANFKDIHDEYGTMADFEALITKAKSLGIKIILDYVPNHSSDQCEWFLKSIDREPGYEDFYIWNDGVLDDDGIRQPPNNWQSVFYGSAWTWNDKREQYYLHQFAAGQPDLNYRNPRVVEEMDNVMRFWLDKGVDGFRIDAVNHLFEVEDLRDEPVSGQTDDKDSYQFTHHYYTKDLPESYEMVYHWRQLLDDYIATHGGDTRIMLTEAYANISFTMDYYESEEGRQGSHVPFNFLLITDVNAESDARDFVFNIQKWLTYMPRGATANWVLGNHDQPRVGSRYGVERIDAMNMLLMTLPGIAITYNGEEIGMVDYRNISWEDTKDPAAKNTNPDVYEKLSRDPERTPFQWDSSENAGFSEGSSTWIPVHPNYVSLNLVSEQQKSRSHYKLYRRLANLRKHPTLQNGCFYPLAINRNILAYKRELQGYDTFVVVINMASKEQTVNLMALGKLPETMIVVAAGSDSNYREGNLAVTSHLVLTAFDSVVLEGLTHKVPQRIQVGQNRMETILSIGALTLLGLLLVRAFNNRFPVPSYTKFI